MAKLGDIIFHSKNNDKANLYHLYNEFLLFVFHRLSEHLNFYALLLIFQGLNRSVKYLMTFPFLRHLQKSIYSTLFFLATSHASSPAPFSSGSIDCCLDTAHNSNAVTSLSHVYHFLLFLCYFTNAYLPLVEKEKQKENKKWDISAFIAQQSNCTSWKKNHQKCEGLICCFLKIDYCSWEAWCHSVLIQIPLNMAFIHLFKILLCTHCVWYTEIFSDIFYVQMNTHINYFNIHMPNFNYVRYGWVIFYFIFFTSLFSLSVSHLYPFVKT